MSDEKFKKYLIESIILLKEQAQVAKRAAGHSQEGFGDYAKGMIMEYCSILTLFKHQAFVFCLDQKELGLADIDPERDLLGLRRNPEADVVEDNWAIEEMKEERVKGYLWDTLSLLKEQAHNVQQEVEHPQQGFEYYNKGALIALGSIFALLKHQAESYNIDETEISLADSSLRAPGSSYPLL